MRNKFKKGVCLLVGMALTLSAATSCKDSEKKNPLGDEGNAEVTLPDDLNQNQEHEGVYTRAHEMNEELADDPALPDINVTDKITLLSWYDIDETSPTAELYKARYWQPEEGAPVGEDGKPTPREIFNYEKTTYENRYVRLNAMIMSGESPDVFPFEERGFPYGVHANQYMPIDDVVDLSGPEWDKTRDVIELFKWGGHNYTAVTELNNSSALLFYRQSVTDEAGVGDPYDMWKRGDWNWDTFKAMVKDFSKPNEKWGIVGTYIDEAAILSTGTGIISLEDGLLKSNMEDKRIERAMSFLQELATNDYRYPYHTLSNYQISPNPFRAGEVLFWNDGPWRYQETLKKISDAEQWPEDEICIVPFPQDPQADDYYHRGKQDALLLVAGAKNKDGFRAWVQCGIVVQNDDNMKLLGREKASIDYGWTEKHLDVLEEIRALTPVWDFKNGIGPDIADPTVASEVENLSKPVITEGNSYTKLRGENSGPILKRIQEMNDKVSGN